MKYIFISLCILLFGCSTSTQPIDPHIANSTKHSTLWLINSFESDTVCSCDIYWSDKRMDTIIDHLVDTTIYVYDSTGYFLQGALYPKYQGCGKCMPSGTFHLNHRSFGEFEDRHWEIVPSRYQSTIILNIQDESIGAKCSCSYNKMMGSYILQ